MNSMERMIEDEKEMKDEILPYLIKFISYIKINNIPYGYVNRLFLLYQDKKDKKTFKEAITWISFINRYFRVGYNQYNTYKIREIVESIKGIERHLNEFKAADNLKLYTAFLDLLE